MGREQKNRPSKSKGPEYALVADGETERWYIQQFMHYYNVLIKLTPELPKSKTLKEQYKLIENFVKNNTYNKILWIIDLDTILKENKDSKNPGKVLAEFKTLYYNALNKWRGRVTVVVNNPCLEYWYCMHDDPNIRTFFESYEKMWPTLKKYEVNKQLFAEYSKNKKDDYLAGEGLFKSLFEDMKLIFASKINEENQIDYTRFRTFDPINCENEGCSEMWKIFEFFGFKQI